MERTNVEKNGESTLRLLEASAASTLNYPPIKKNLEPDVRDLVPLEEHHQLDTNMEPDVRGLVPPKGTLSKPGPCSISGSMLIGVRVSVAFQLRGH